jgi:hypothetical protein
LRPTPRDNSNALIRSTGGHEHFDVKIKAQVVAGCTHHSVGSCRDRCHGDRARVLFALSTIFLHIAIWTWWCLRGRDILFVYSDSPIWREYIDEHILPYLGERAVILNWSERKRWRISLARLAFHHFGGYRQFNPLAVVFRPFRRTRTFRFWQPFRDFNHGHPGALRQMENEFFGLIGIQKT